MLLQTAVKADQFVPIGSTEMNSSPVSPGYWASQPEPPANPSDREQIGGRAEWWWEGGCEESAKKRKNKRKSVHLWGRSSLMQQWRERERGIKMRRRKKGGKVTRGVHACWISLCCWCFLKDIWCSMSSLELSGISASPLVMSHRALTPGPVALPVIFVTSWAILWISPLYPVEGVKFSIGVWPYLFIFLFVLISCSSTPIIISSRLFSWDWFRSALYEPFHLPHKSHQPILAYIPLRLHMNRESHGSI